jgi:hypothetical protein
VPVAGRKPKPPGQAVHRNKPIHDWTEVADVPYVDGPKLPRNRPNGSPWPAVTKRWWQVVSAMPHCRLWKDSDWQFALDTALLAAEFHTGELRLATELRNRERVLGTTVDFRRDLRIRYVDVDVQVEDAEVTRLDDYRDL